MKKVLACLFTDLHISDLNCQTCVDFIEKMCSYIKEKNIKTLFFNGDFFESRKGISGDVLYYTLKIAKMLNSLNIQIIFNYGNHDLYNPNEHEKGLLNIFTPFENIKIIEQPHKLLLDNFRIFFMPYFEGECLENKLKELSEISEKKNDKKSILLSHLGYEQLTAEVTKNFDLLLNGHFHDIEKFPKGMYIGSCFQQNFSEDKYKGFSILYDDLSVEQILFESKEYIIQSIDLNIFTEEKAKEFIISFKKKYKDKYLRIELKGFNKDVSALKDFCRQNNVDCISKIEILSDKDNQDEDRITISTLSSEQIEKYYQDFKNNQTYSIEVDNILKNLLFKKN